MEPIGMAESISMEQVSPVMALGIDEMSGGILGFMVLLYLFLYIGLPFLIILSARSNWRTLHEKEIVVEFVGFWRRIAISLVDVVLSVLIVPLFFNICFYLRDGQTIGDKIYGTKLVDKKSMKTASVGQLWIRGIAKILSTLPFGVGFIAAGWRSEKLAWHDGLSDVRYISYKKVHGIWTWLPFILIFVLPIIVILLLNTVAGA